MQGVKRFSLEKGNIKISYKNQDKFAKLSPNKMDTEDIVKRF